tara:strand:- start:860 stop:1060 length:201 start_codon:yes stop_codon:yes gene_type:complete
MSIEPSSALDVKRTPRLRSDRPIASMQSLRAPTLALGVSEGANAAPSPARASPAPSPSDITIVAER